VYWALPLQLGLPGPTKVENISIKSSDEAIMFDLLALTSLDQFFFIMKILFTFFIKQDTLMRMLTVLSVFPSGKTPWPNNSRKHLYNKWRWSNNVWPPCTNQFRSAPFYNENIIYFFTTQDTLMRRLTVLSVSPSVRTPWPNKSRKHLYKKWRWSKRGILTLSTTLWH
jgi:hypothetical protein